MALNTPMLKSFEWNKNLFMEKVHCHMNSSGIDIWAIVSKNYRLIQSKKEFLDAFNK
jgi:hypothetical protein